MTGTAWFLIVAAIPVFFVVVVVIATSLRMAGILSEEEDRHD